MDIRHLNYFLVLAEELHFGRASERLHISQPPLSRMIRQIETDFGVRLFERSKRKVMLTPAGIELLQQTRQMVTHMDTVKKRLSIIGQGESGILRIGYVGATMHSAMPEFLSSFLVKYPQIHFTLEEQPNENLLHALNNGTMDVAFVRTWLHPKKLEEKLILEETFVAVLPRKHPLANKRRIDVKSLKDETFITFSRECGPTIFDNFLALCGKAGFTPAILHQASQLNSVLRWVESGFGVSLLPAYVEKGYNLDLKFIPLSKGSEKIPLLMLFRKENPNPSLKILQKHLLNNRRDK